MHKPSSEGGQDGNLLGFSCVVAALIPTNLYRCTPQVSCFTSTSLVFDSLLDSYFMSATMSVACDVGSYDQNTNSNAIYSSSPICFFYPYIQVSIVIIKIQMVVQVEL